MWADGLEVACRFTVYLRGEGDVSDTAKSHKKENDDDGTYIQEGR
jgi:hypothetical protein